MTRKKPTVALVSLGCPKNLVDSEKILGQLAQGGCVVQAPMDQADVIIVNTCGFLAAARDESLAVIAEAVAHKRAGRAQRVIVAGCLVNRDADKLFELAPGIDAIVGVNDRGQILQAVEGKGPAARITDNPASLPGRRGIAAGGWGRSSDAGRFRLTPRHTAYLRISEGCSQRCTFCTIPSIRGPLRSKPPRTVLREAGELIADGAVELNVIGQDTTSYGLDRQRPGARAATNLAGLLASLDRLEGIGWIRLMYAYPRRFTDELMDTMAQCSHVVKYVDLPLQHINDVMLRKMGRGVGRAATEKLLLKLREKMPQIHIRTTVIVGFPGETDARFEELLQFVRDFKFEALGVFEFSPEPLTPAAAMQPAVPKDVKAHRASAIMLAQQKIAFAANRARVGQSLDVLVDGLDSQGRCVGRHSGQGPDVDSVCIIRPARPAGGFMRAKVVAADGYDLVVRPERIAT